MRPSAKILCAFGLIAIFCSLVALFLIDHMPLQGGMESIPPAGISHEEKTRWYLDLLIGSIGIGLRGLSF